MQFAYGIYISTAWDSLKFDLKISMSIFMCEMVMARLVVFMYNLVRYWDVML